MATVALVGMPILHVLSNRSSHPLWRCEAGATGQLRKDLEQMILEAIPGITVINKGELVTPKAAVSEADYAELCLKAKEVVASSGADTVLVVGGSHVAALPFYGLPGNRVLRADAHGDAYVTGCKRPELNGGTYMHFVARKGLKRANEILNVGVRTDLLGKQWYYNMGVFGSLVSLSQALAAKLELSFFDIDIDVLAEAYGLPHQNFTSDLKAEDLAGLISRHQPGVVGLFECVDFYGKMPPDIVSQFKNVFYPICKAVAEVAVARSAF